MSELTGRQIPLIDDEGAFQAVGHPGTSGRRYAEATMNRDKIAQSLRAEIAHLQRVLDLMEEVPNTAPERGGPGRPKGAAGRVASVKPEPPTPKKRVMSAEGKARIAAAQKKRWAKAKRATASNAQNSKALAVTRGAGSKPSKTQTGSRSPKTMATPKKAAQPAAKKKARAVSRPVKSAADQTPVTE